MSARRAISRGAAVLFSIAIVCVAFEWERVASHLSNWVDRATGRDFEIRGDIDLDFSWWPLLVVEDVPTATRS